MKLKVILAFLFFISLNICFGQTDSADKKTITKNQEPKAGTKNISETKTDTIKEPQKSTKKDSKTTTKKIIPTNNGVGLSDVVAPVAIDTVKYLKDSIHVLNKTISKLGKEKEELQEENDDLQNQIAEHSGEKGKKSERKNWRDWVVEKIYNITKGVLLILAFITLVFILKNRKNLKSAILNVKQLLLMKKKKNEIMVPPPPQIKTVNPQTKNPVSKPTIQTPTPIIQQTPKVTPAVEYNLPKSFSNIYYQQPKSGKDNWFVVGVSSVGKSHITSNKPCQDNHFCASIKEGWGIAVSCDGAGSSEHSDLGSQFVAEKSVEVFKSFLTLNKFVDENRLPNNEEWQSMSKLAFVQIYNSLIDYSKSEKLEFNSLACTSIVVVFTPMGLLSAHIGDGRAGYCNSSGDWKPLITPHKGEEANQTIFLTSSPWLSETDFKMSEVLVPESRVINEKVIAFTLMSDGCESHSFDCSKMDNETNKWVDPNLPSEKFFNPLLKQLKAMHDNKVSLPDVTSNWKKFIEGGTPGLKDEPDDKTLILGILI
ncbi:MAG: protein phosphatase 2C domain-containing protein [Bacteroidia bacterium]|nr:protein phosphatase 2C domain-containing protein [Bacteroidia bacterium]